MTCGAVGAVVTQRRPENTIGWLFLVIGFLFAIESLIDAYTVISVLVAPADLPGQPWLGWTLTWLWVPPIGLAFIFLPLLFPTGHLPSERGRPVAWLGALGTTAFGIAIAFAPGPIQQATYLDNPIHPFGEDVAAYGVIEGFGVLPFGIAVILAVASLVRRFREGDDVARRQIKWFALAATVAAAAYAGYVVTYLLANGTPLAKAFEVTQVAAVIGMPVAAGLAILRYRLFEIDPDHQSNDLVRAGHRFARDRLRARDPRPPGTARIGHGRRDHRRRPVDARRGRPLPAAADAGEGVGGSTLRPRSIRRGSHIGRIRGTDAR